MDAGELAVAALTGSLGAVIAIVGSVSVLAVTWRKERRDAALRAQEAASAIVDRERAERIARVRVAVNKELLTAASKWSGLRMGHGLAEVHWALSEVVIHEAAEHPAVSHWTLEQLKAFGKAVERVQRWWLLPGHRARLAKVVTAPTDAATALSYWQAGHLTEEWFARHSQALAPFLSAEAQPTGLRRLRARSRRPAVTR